jgi:hypothetical protein
LSSSRVELACTETYASLTSSVIFFLLVESRERHGIGFTRGLQATVLTVTGTVLDFDNPMETVPIPVVSRYHTYTLSGSGPNNNDDIPLKTCSKPPTSKVAHVLFKQAHQSLTLACINSIAGRHTLLSCCYFHTYVSYYCITYLLQQMGKHISQKVHDN